MDRTNTPELNDSAQKPQYLDQGWTDKVREDYYNTSQGSKLVPYQWFVNLEQSGSDKPFNSKDYLGDKFGSLYDKNELPIGFVKAKDNPAPLPPEQQKNLDNTRVARLTDVSKTYPTGEWLGLTCASCHTGELQYKGQSKRIDGGPAMADFIGFARGLRDAFKDTLNDEQKFNRFANKVLDQPNNEQVAELHKAVEKYSQALSGWVDRADNATPYGFGRLDAFNILVNEIVGTALDHPENYRKADAPVSYPPLWQTPNMDWVQWNGSAVEPLSRNTGEVLGVFGELDLKEGSSTFGHSSAQIRDLHALEEYLKELQPPKWPAEFGELDPDKVKRGKEVYDSENCASCHDAGKYTNKNGRELIKTTLVPLDVIKTDPTMATDFATRTANPGPFKPYFGGKDQVPLPAMIGPAVKTVIKEGFAREKIPPSEVPAYTDHREERQRTLQELKGYKAPQLQGVWATAPYLHNGSVPTLDDLFKPSSQRPSNFMVGSREFDPDKVGFETEKGKSNFDTTLKGNSNLGHEGPGFGTELNKDDREALIAYLKSL